MASRSREHKRERKSGADERRCAAEMLMIRSEGNVRHSPGHHDDDHRDPGRGRGITSIASGTDSHSRFQHPLSLLRQLHLRLTHQ